MSTSNMINVYDYVNRAVLRDYPTAYVSGAFEPVVPRFPSVCIRQIGWYSREGNVTFSGEQGVWYSTFEVQVQTALENSEPTYAHEIMDCVITAFKQIYYINTAVNLLEDGDRGIYRLTATFRRIIGSAETISDSPYMSESNTTEP